MNLAVAVISRDPQPGPIQIIAHRVDAPEIPENTYPGLEFALANGVRAVEIDIRRTEDGVVVLSHDQSLKRMAGVDRFVENLTWDEIQTMPLLHDAADGTGFRIARLTDIIALCRANRIWMMIEFKTPELYPGIASDVLGLLGDDTDSVTFISFDRQWAAVQSQIAGRKIQTGTLHFSTRPLPSVLGQDDVHVAWQSIILDPACVRAAHKNGQRVVAWTVNNVFWAKYLRWLGVDGMTTDNYIHLQSALSQEP